MPHPADDAPYERNLANQVGALPAAMPSGRGLPLDACWFYFAHGATNAVEHAFSL